MTKGAQLSQHLEAWKTTYESLGGTFCFDGRIGANDEWCTTSGPRVLFLSKDCNDSRGVMKPVGYDLCRLLREATRPSNHVKMFERELGAWAFGIEQLYAGAHVEYRNITRQDTAASLLRCAVVNAKKLAGTRRASDAEVKAAIQRDCTRLLEQISMRSPTLVVCCGTIQYFKGVVDLHGQPYGVKWSNHCHPCWWQNGLPANFDGLMAKVAAIM